jgi:hypothetical protein
MGQGEIYGLTFGLDVTITNSGGDLTAGSQADTHAPC